MTTLRRYLAAIILLLLTVILAVAGLLFVTKWKPAQVVEASGTTNAPFLTTRPGLFELYGDGEAVNLTATAPNPDQKIWIVMGSQSDADGWLHGHDYEEIYGLSDLTTLKMEQHRTEPPAPQSGEEVAEEPAEAPQSGAEDVNPMASDMWVLDKSGTGSLQMNISGERMDLVLVAATNGTDPAPEITLEWDTPAENYPAIFLFSFAALFLFLALFVWFILWRTQRRRRAIRRRMEARLRADSTETSVIPVVSADKEAEAAEEAEEDAEVSVAVDAELEVADADESAIVEEAAVEEETWAPQKEQTTEGQPESETVADAPAEEVVEEEEPAEVAEEAGPPPSAPAGFLDKTQELSTDSGMINLAALRGGAKFPTRRALREAQARGVETFIIEGSEYRTTPAATPTTTVDEKALQETSHLLGQRASRSSKWSSAFGEAEPEGEGDPRKDSADE